MFQKLLIAFVALFIITNRVSATEFPALPELPKHSIENLEEVEETEEYENVQTKKGCFATCMKGAKDICTDKNIELGKDVVENIAELIKNIYEALNK